MDKKKHYLYIKIVSGIIIVICLLIVLVKWEDRRNIKWEEQKTKEENQNKAEAEKIAEDYMDSFTEQLETALYCSILKDIKASYKQLDYSEEELNWEFGYLTEEPADYKFYYRVSFHSDSIEKAYQEAKNSDNMAAFCEALSKVKLKKDDVYNDGFKHNEYMNDKTIFCCCITETKGFELSINGPSGAMYRYTDNSYENVRYLEIDDQVVYSEVKDCRNDDSLDMKENGSSSISNSGSSSNSSGHDWKYSDSYDVDDYDDPDNFAEEWAEEFGDGNYDSGYDEAYDYYWENQ